MRALDSRPPLPRRPQRHGRRRRRARRQVGGHRLQSSSDSHVQQSFGDIELRRLHAMQRQCTVLNPDIFKAYDVRGTYPDQIHEDGRAGDRRGVRRVSEGRADRRRPRHAALVAGARRGVHRRRDAAGRRRRRLRDDSDRHAVLRRRARRLDGGVQITASHNPKQYNGMKMVRQEAFPLSGDEGISRHPRHDRRRSPPAAGGAPRAASRTKDVLDAVRRARDVVHRSRDHQAVQRRARRRQRHGRPGRAAALRPAALQDDAALLRDRRPVSQSRSQSAHRRKPPRHRRARRRGEGRHRHRVGRRRRSLFLHRRRRRVRLRRLHHGAPRRGVSAEASRARRSSTTCAPATPSGTSSRATAARR